jgi:hypothetical protein
MSCTMIQYVMYNDTMSGTLRYVRFDDIVCQVQRCNMSSTMIQYVMYSDTMSGSMIQNVRYNDRT